MKIRVWDHLWDIEKKRIKVLAFSEGRSNYNRFILEYSLNGEILSATTIPMKGHLYFYTSDWARFVASKNKKIAVWNDKGKLLESRNLPFDPYEMATSSESKLGCICISGRNHKTIYFDPTLIKPKTLQPHPFRKKGYAESIYPNIDSFRPYDTSPEISPDGSLSLIHI